MVPPFLPLDDSTLSNHPEVSIELNDETTLGDTIDMAAERLGVFLDRRYTHTPTVSQEIEGIAFDRPGDPYRRPISELTLVDAEGQASWGHWWASVTYGDLLRAAEVGLIVGDVSRLYLRPMPPAGGIGDAEEWRQLLDNLDLLWEVVQGVGVIHASALAMGAAQRRIRRGIDAIRTSWQKWQERGGTPHRLTLMLTQKDWSTVEIARLLGCDEPTAQAVMELFGLAQDPRTRRWRLNGDELAALLAGNWQLLLWDRISFGTTAQDAEAHLKAILRERVTYLVERNEAPPKPDYREIAQQEWEPPA